MTDRIAQLENELSAVAAHSLAQGKRLRAAQAELDRLRTELEAWRAKEWAVYQNRQGLTSDYAAATVHEISTILEGDSHA